MTTTQWAATATAEELRATLLACDGHDSNQTKEAALEELLARKRREVDDEWQAAREAGDVGIG